MTETRSKQFIIITILVFSFAAAGDVLFSSKRKVGELFRHNYLEDELAISRTYEEVHSLAEEVRKIEFSISKNPEFEREFNSVLEKLREAALKLEALKEVVEVERGEPGV